MRIAGRAGLMDVLAWTFLAANFAVSLGLTFPIQRL